MGAGFRRELRLNPGGQWGKSWTDAGPQRARDCSWVLIPGFDSTFILQVSSLKKIRDDQKVERQKYFTSALKKNPQIA